MAFVPTKKNKTTNVLTVSTKLKVFSYHYRSYLRNCKTIGGILEVRAILENVASPYYFCILSYPLLQIFASLAGEIVKDGAFELGNE